MAKAVTFEPVDGPINDRVDETYREKYEGSQYLDAMVSERARSTTLTILPRETGD